MLGGEMYQTIKVLKARGKSKSEIARLTGHDRKTIRKVIKKLEKGIELPEKKPHPRKLDSYQAEIHGFLEENLSALRIYQKLSSQGVNISYASVKNYCANIKKRQNIFVRIHTKPGQEAQVDFGYAGLTNYKEGKKRKTWVFNMRLGYSRYDYYEKVYDQRVETFIQCHINAFKAFGGVPAEVVIDNLKAAILEANFYDPIYQELYKRFAEDYGFMPVPCKVRDPNRKGKVESGIKYVKNNFFAGRKFKDHQDLDKRLSKWVKEICNERIHGTTRKIPREIFEAQERTKLKRLPLEDFKMSKVGNRKVYHDCHIYVEYNYYSVPYEYIGKEVGIDLSQKLLKISYQGQEIAIHPRLEGRGEFSTNDSHYPKYKRRSETEYQEKYQTQMLKLGNYAQEMFFIILTKHGSDWSRYVQGILSLEKKYKAEIINLACKRAIAFKVYRYKVIEAICKNGSYKQPLDLAEREELKNECA